MKRKWISMGLALFMVLSMVPFTAFAADAPVPQNRQAAETFAAETGVAEVGNTTYNTLSDAINAASTGSIVTLLKDVEGMYTVSKKLTLDLNGKTITSNDPNGGVLVYGPHADLTIKDSYADSEGNTNTGTIVAQDGSGVWVYQGKLTVESGTIKTTKAGEPGIYLGDNTTAQIKGGKIQAHDGYGISVWANSVLTVDGGTVTGGQAAITGNGTSGRGNNTITINGGTVVSACFGIYHPQMGTLTINGGAIIGGSAIGIKAGDLIVNGGTINGNGAYTTLPKPNSDGMENDGSAILAESNEAYGHLNITINNGTLQSENGHAIREFAGMDVAATHVDSITIKNGDFQAASGKPAIEVRPVSDEKIAVSGGMFSSTVKKEHCTDGFLPVEQEDGSFVVMVVEIAVTGDQVTYEVSTETGAVRLVLARYDAERMTGVTMIDLTKAAKGTATLTGTGNDVRAFLLTGEYAPVSTVEQPGVVVKPAA